MNAAELKNWLKQHKRTQKWLAQSLNVDIKTVNRWLNGRGAIPSYVQDWLPSILQDIMNLEEPTSKAPATITPAPQGISDAEIIKAAHAINRSPQELIEAILQRASKKIAEAIAPAIEDTKN